MELPFDPTIPLLRLYPKNPETPIQKNLCTAMFIAAQFTIAKCWKQPKCPPVNEWIKKTVVHLHNGILCSRKKGDPTLCDSMLVRVFNTYGHQSPLVTQIACFGIKNLNSYLKQRYSH